MKQLSRRAILRGSGTALALPMLEAMLPRRASAADAKLPARMVAIYTPHGVANEQWYPSKYGRDFELSPSLKPLAPVRDAVTVLTGLCHPRMPAGSAHSGAGRWLTGVNPGDRVLNDFASPNQSWSMDQLAAQHIGHLTRLPSLQLSSQSGAGLPGRSSTLSFNPRGIPLPSLDKPRAVFNRLFVPDTPGGKRAEAERLARRRSLLDSVTDEAKRLQKQLGQGDRERLEEYLHAVRAAEIQVQRNQTWLDRPKAQVSAEGLAFNYPDRSSFIRLMYDLMFLALRTDTTRIATFMTGVEVDGYNWQELGFKHGHHGLQHHNGQAEPLRRLAAVDKRQVALFTHFLERLRAAEEADGNMLDRTMLLIGSGMNNGKGLKNGTGTHGARKLPLLLAGGMKLGIRQGQHLLFENDETPLCNLHLTMLQAMDVPVSSFVDGTTRLAGV
jgi:hypothetical protein